MSRAPRRPRNEQRAESVRRRDFEFLDDMDTDNDDCGVAWGLSAWTLAIWYGLRASAGRRRG